MALSKAVEDFDGDRFKDKTKRIIVIWGGGVDCRKDLAHSTADIGAMLRRKKNEDPHFSPDLRFIGMGLLKEQQDQLRKIAEETKGQFIAVEDRRQLTNALRKVLVMEPLGDAVKGAIEHLNKQIYYQNQFLGQLNGKNYSDAAASLEKAEIEVVNLDASIRAAGDRQSEPEVGKLHELLIKSRGLQANLLEVSRKLLDVGKTNNIEMFNDRSDEYNKYIKACNASISDLNTALQEISR